MLGGSTQLQKGPTYFAGDLSGIQQKKLPFWFLGLGIYKPGKKIAKVRDWAEKLDAFLKFNERDVLEGAGRVSKKQADAHAEGLYEQFAAQRRALLEAEGAKFNVRALEDAARALPKLKQK